MKTITTENYEAFQARIDSGEKIACKTEYGLGILVYVTYYTICVRVYKTKVILPHNAIEVL